MSPQNFYWYRSEFFIVPMNPASEYLPFLLTPVVKFIFHMLTIGEALI